MKTGKRILTAIAILFLIIPVYATNSQHWNDLVIAGKLSPRVSLEIYNRTRWHDIPFTETFQTCLQGGLKYKIDPRMSALFAYRYDMLNKVGYYEFENRFLLQFAYKMPVQNICDLELAQRTELRYFTRSTEDHIRLRVISTFSRKFTVYGLPVKPSIAGELFWDDIADEINRSRLYTGFSFDIKPRYTFKLIWIHQTDKDKSDTEIFDTGLTISL
jgi:hypothetical protein